MAPVCNTLLFFLLFKILLLVFSATPNQWLHPLDPLTPLEIEQVRIIITATHHNLTFHYVGLDEPDKPIVLSWLSHKSTAKPPPRRALAVARIGRQTHQFTVDLYTHAIVSNEIYTGSGYPIITLEEQEAANSLALAHAPLQASLRRRGLQVKEVVGVSYTVGWYGEEGRSRRIVKVMFCYLDGTVNLYMRPIEGIAVTVDLDEMKVVAYQDRLIVPVPKAEGTDYRETEQKPPFLPPLKDITVVQPNGPSFTIHGHHIR